MRRTHTRRWRVRPTAAIVAGGRPRLLFTTAALSLCATSRRACGMHRPTLLQGCHMLRSTMARHTHTHRPTHPSPTRGPGDARRRTRTDTPTHASRADEGFAHSTEVQTIPGTPNVAGATRLPMCRGLATTTSLVRTAQARANVGDTGANYTALHPQGLCGWCRTISVSYPHRQRAGARRASCNRDSLVEESNVSPSRPGGIPPMAPRKVWRQPDQRTQCAARQSPARQGPSSRPTTHMWHAGGRMMWVAGAAPKPDSPRGCLANRDKVTEYDGGRRSGNLVARMGRALGLGRGLCATGVLQLIVTLSVCPTCVAGAHAGATPMSWPLRPFGCRGGARGWARSAGEQQHAGRHTMGPAARPAAPRLSRAEPVTRVRGDCCGVLPNGPAGGVG